MLPDYTMFMASSQKESMLDLVVNRITDAVMSGKLHPGDRLPTELQLAEMLGVSKNTVREAIKVLVAYGVVEIRRPEGTFICESFTPKMMSPLIYSALFSKTDSNDILGLREMIDTGLLLTLMRQGLSPEDRDALEEQHRIYCETVSAPEFDREAILEEDLIFHRMLAKAAHNELIYIIHDFVLGLTRESRARALQMAYDDGKNLEYIMAAHRKTLDVAEQKEDAVLGSVLDFTYRYWKNSFDI